VQCIKISNCVVSHKEIEPKKNFSDINTGKTLPKNCWNLSTSLKCFACIYYHWKKFLVQSVYVKRRTLISLYIAHTLVGVTNFLIMSTEFDKNSSKWSCHCHSESKCLISFRNWFWHLIVATRSIRLNFYQKRPVFA
jgi:hypothetical protein